MGPGRGFWMILHTENRQFFMAHSFHRSVIQIDMSDLNIRRQRFRIDRKTMVLRGDRDLPAL